MQVQQGGECWTVAIEGELERTNAHELVERVEQALALAALAVEVDLELMTYVDAGGAAALETCWVRCDAAGVPIRLLRPTAALRRVLSLAGLSRLLDEAG